MNKEQKHMSVLEFVKRVVRTVIGGSPKRVVGWHCVHRWKKRPDLNVLYACGEDGAFGWKCSGCGLVARTDEDMPPNAPGEPPAREQQ